MLAHTERTILKRLVVDGVIQEQLGFSVVD